MENSINELLSGQLNALEDESLLQELDDLFASLETPVIVSTAGGGAPPVGIGTGAADLPRGLSQAHEHEGIDSMPIAPTTPILPAVPTAPIVLSEKSAISRTAAATSTAVLG